MAKGLSVLLSSTSQLAVAFGTKAAQIVATLSQPPKVIDNKLLPLSVLLLPLLTPLHTFPNVLGGTYTVTVAAVDYGGNVLTSVATTATQPSDPTTIPTIVPGTVTVITGV